MAQPLNPDTPPPGGQSPVEPITITKQPNPYLPMIRQLVAEFLGTALLVTVVVGSGIAASNLSPTDAGLQLFYNSFATALGLTILILIFAPVSGAHFNPVVTIAEWFLGRRNIGGFPANRIAPYLIAQFLGAAAGCVFANIMFEIPTAISTKQRISFSSFISEIAATAILVLLIFALVRTGRATLAAPAVGAYIGAAYWFKSSTSFANPAVTFGRIFTNTFAGIAPSSVLPFIGAQILGLIIGIALIKLLFPQPSITEAQ